MKILIFTITIIELLLISVQSTKLKEKFAWKQLDFAWPSENFKQDALASGRYIPENNLPLGLDVWKDKLFITVPRWKSGVAASLTYVQLPTEERSPILQPYPSWEANTLPIEVNDKSQPASHRTTGGRAEAKKPAEVGQGLIDNSTIISTFRITVDECDRLWVMDTGLADILGDPKQIAPPAIVIFDLNTNRLIKRYTIPASNSKEDTFFANIIVDTSEDDCNNAHAYIPDLGAYGVVVYSFKNDRSWRVKHNFFHFDPLNGDYNVGGVNFQWTDGVFGMALDSINIDGTRNVYFHALSSTKEFVVPNKVLQNETYVTSPSFYYEFKLLGDRGQNGQATAEVYDEENDVIFYTQVNKDAIGCWNTNSPYNADNQGLVDSDSTALIFPNDIKIDQIGNLWVLSDRMPIFIYASLNSNDYNYRILKGRTKDIISGTPCEKCS